MGENELCDEEKFHQLENRVDSIDSRLTKVETSLTDMRGECQRGFASIEKHMDRIYEQINNVYDERSKWGAWARSNLAKAFGWIAVIVLAACGITQATSVAKLFMNK